MKVLYISDRRTGGIASHVKCLAECLPPDVGRYVIGVGGDEPFAGRSGHDVREFFQIRRVIREFKPDVVHFHIPNLFMVLYIRLSKLFNLSTLKPFNSETFQPFNLLCSWHTPTNRPPSVGQRLFLWLLGKECYFLPVSTPTWEGLRKWLPQAKGEVFHNPMKIGGEKRWRWTKDGNDLVVGMVGRNDDQKDWPAFHKVESIVQARLSQLKSADPLSTSTSSLHLSFLNAGEKEACDGREAIAKMDLFVMTSKHEELPTTVLECFALGTPVCGFVPVGGMSDILKLSSGPLREAFVAERSCEKLSDVVLDLLSHPEKRQALVEDGRQVLEGHFDAEKNCRGRLMEIYLWNMMR